MCAYDIQNSKGHCSHLVYPSFPRNYYMSRSMESFLYECVRVGSLREKFPFGTPPDFLEF